MAIKIASKVSHLSPRSGEVGPLLPRSQWVSCHEGIMPLPLWRGVVVITDKQLQAADKGWFSTLTFGRETNSPS